MTHDQMVQMLALSLTVLVLAVQASKAEKLRVGDGLFGVKGIERRKNLGLGWSQRI